MQALGEGLDVGGEAGFVARVAVQVVQGDAERMIAGGAEQRFQRLGADLHAQEFRLGGGVAAVRGVPVAVVVQAPAARAGHAPVRHFVERTAEIIAGVADAGGFTRHRCAGHRCACQIHRLFEAAFQHGVVALEKSIPKQRFQVGGAVHHATGLRYGSRPVIRL